LGQAGGFQESCLSFRTSKHSEERCFSSPRFARIFHRGLKWEKEQLQVYDFENLDMGWINM
jgi:hypothetical protein